MPLDALSWNLLIAAAGVAVVHTAFGPDHYLPFVMIGRARRWSMARILVVTLLCGIGHVGSSLLLGGIGIAIGAAIGGIEALEALRGSAAGWALVALGAAYALWGWRQATRHRHGFELHRHDGEVHIHADGTVHHHHHHLLAPPHRHGEAAPNATFWALFLVFVLGPCEPLLPLFVAPASEGRWGLAALVGGVFAVATIATMLVVTGVLYAGVARLRLGPLERWSHAMAGGVVALSGLGIVALGL
ncbi:MAG: sulfite exporter TauE/SafE family protein [Planctomycetota bacterium]